MATVNESRSNPNRVSEAHTATSVQTVTNALLLAISAGGRSAHALAKESGVCSDSIRKFISRERSIALNSADKLASILGLLMVRTVSETLDDHPTKPISAILRAAIANSGFSIPALTSASGVRSYSIARFVDGDGSLILDSADKLAVVLGLQITSRAWTKGSEMATCPEPRPQPLSACLREAMTCSRLSAHVMAKKSGLHSYAIRRFLASESSLNLESADKLAAMFGLRIALQAGNDKSGQATRDDTSQPLSVGMRSALERAITGGRSVYALAKESGVHHMSIREFLRLDRSICLDTADKLATSLEAKIIRPDPVFCDDHSSRKLLAGLRSAIMESGLDASTIANLSGLRIPLIRRFVADRQDIKYDSAVRLANALGYELELAKPQRQAVPPPAEPQPANSPTRRCPVELRGEAFPVRVYDRDLPRISGVAYTMLKKLVDAFLSGGGCTPKELSRAAESGRLRVLARAFDRHGFEPLRKVIPNYKGTKGRVIEIVDPGSNLVFE